MNHFKKKLIPALIILAAAIASTACSRNPTLDRSILDGYKTCVEAAQKRLGIEYIADREAGKSTAGRPSGYAESYCKEIYDISKYRNINEYRIVN